MNTLHAFYINQSTPDGHEKVFDWDKAAKIIKEEQPESAYAGLAEDWEWTSGIIYENSKPIKNKYTYLASRWATPVLILDDKEIECYQPDEYHGWNADTKWPESALKILSEENQEQTMKNADSI